MYVSYSLDVQTYCKEHFKVLPLANIRYIYDPLSLFHIKSIPVNIKCDSCNKSTLRSSGGINGIKSCSINHQ